MRSTLVTLLAAAVLAQAPLAHAQDADKLFKSARKLVEAGDYTHACPMFAESERLEPAPGTLLNLADCEKNVGQLLSAQEHYRLAASGFPKNDPRRAFCAKKADDLDARIAHVTLRLAPGVPDGTVVKRDGVVFGDLGKSVPMDPRTTSIVVTAPGRVDHSYPLTIKDADSLDLTLQVGDVEAPRVEVVRVEGNVTPPETPTPTTSSSPLRPAGIVVASVGVVSLAAGVVTGLMALDRANTVKTHCNTTTNICLDQTGYDAAQDGRVLSPVSTVTFIVGGVLAAAGAVLFIVGGKHAHAATRALLSPTIGPSGVGVNLTGTF